MIGAVGVLSALLALGLNANRWKIFATVVVALVLIRVYPSDDGRVETVRSFFGVHKIVVTPHGQYHVLMHGTTIHGAREIPEQRRHARLPGGPSRSPTTTGTAASGRRSRRSASARARRSGSR